MSAGLPLIASDFPAWRDLILMVQCGLVVDPLSPEAIAGAMQWLLDHPEEAAGMGERGRQAVKEVYRWETEGSKLVALYGQLLGGQA